MQAFEWEKVSLNKNDNNKWNLISFHFSKKVC